MRLQILIKSSLLMFLLAFGLPAYANHNLACSTGGNHTCSLHDQHDQHVGDHCQCNDENGGHHSVQGTIVSLVCTTHSGHSCSTNNHHLGAQCGCNENGHQVTGTVAIEHHANQNQNQNNQNQSYQNQNYRSNQH